MKLFVKISIPAMLTLAALMPVAQPTVATGDSCENAATLFGPAGTVSGHLGAPFESRFYQVNLRAGDTLILYGTLTNGDVHFGFACLTELFGLNSNGPIIYTAGNDGNHKVQVHAHEAGGNYNLVYAIVPGV